MRRCSCWEICVAVHGGSGLSSTVSAVAALLSLPLSIVAFVMSIRTQRYTLHAATISDWYREMNELSNLRITHWQTAHLIELPESYSGEVAVLRAALASASEAELRQYELLERAVAVRIFEIFEQIVYHLRLAIDVGDHRKAVFLEEVKNYMTGRLLLNPRLLYLWSALGGRLNAYFEPYTKEIYDKEVGQAAPETMDARGPYR